MSRRRAADDSSRNAPGHPQDCKNCLAETSATAPFRPRRTLAPSHPRTLAPSHPRTLAPSHRRTLASHLRTVAPSRSCLTQTSGTVKFGLRSQFTDNQAFSSSVHPTGVRDEHCHIRKLTVVHRQRSGGRFGVRSVCPSNHSVRRSHVLAVVSGVQPRQLDGAALHGRTAGGQRCATRRAAGERGTQRREHPRAAGRGAVGNERSAAWRWVVPAAGSTQSALVEEIKRQLQNEMGLLPVRLLRERRGSFVELNAVDNFGQDELRHCRIPGQRILHHRQARRHCAATTRTTTGVAPDRVGHCPAQGSRPGSPDRGQRRCERRGPPRRLGHHPRA